MFRFSEKSQARYAQSLARRKKGEGQDQMVERIMPYLRPLRGDVLEIGAGAGNALSGLPVQVKYTAVEPNRYLHNAIETAARAHGFVTPMIISARCEQLPFAASTFDAVLSVRSLCAVHDLARALQEIRRVLKPGGILIFAEHVAAPRWSFAWFMQLFSRPFFNCNTARDIESLLRQAGYVELRVERFKMPGWGIIKPRIFGFARV